MRAAKKIKVSRVKFVKTVLPKLSNLILKHLDREDKLPDDPGKLFDYMVENSECNEFALYVPDSISDVIYGEDLDDEDLAECRTKFCKSIKQQRQVREIIRLNKFIKMINLISAEAIHRQDKNGWGVGDTATDEDITSDLYQQLHR